MYTSTVLTNVAKVEKPHRGWFTLCGSLHFVRTASLDEASSCASADWGKALRPMKFCYADPPYLGCGAKHYSHQHEQAADYDDPETHRQLISRLVAEFPDGWALSLHTPSLRIILPMCPEDVRVMAWVKPFASFKKNVTVAYAWEPVIVRGGRKRPTTEPTVRDWVAACITLEKGCAGAKPEDFSLWLFEVLGANRDDELVDLFPGSGAVAKAWEKFRNQRRLSFAEAV